MLLLLYNPKNYFLALGLALLSDMPCYAQDAAAQQPNIAEHNKPALLSNSAYYYPDFKKGTVVFISGAASSAIINYNVEREEVEYIRAKKDTLTFNDMYLIDMIAVENDTFFYDNRNACVLKLLNSINGWKLLVKERTIATQEKASTLQNVPASSSSMYYISKQADYMPVTAANFLKLFPAHANTLKNYIAEHHLNLKTEEEIYKVLRYVASL